MEAEAEARQNFLSTFFDRQCFKTSFSHRLGLRIPSFKESKAWFRETEQLMSLLENMSKWNPSGTNPLKQKLFFQLNRSVCGSHEWKHLHTHTHIHTHTHTHTLKKDCSVGSNCGILNSGERGSCTEERWRVCLATSQLSKVRTIEFFQEVFYFLESATYSFFFFFVPK